MPVLVRVQLPDRDIFKVVRRMKESSLVRSIMAKIRKLVPAERLIALRKLADGFTRGLPDIQVIAVKPILGGRVNRLLVLEIEVKRPEGKESALQEHERTATAAKVEAALMLGTYRRVTVTTVKEVKNILIGD